MKPLGAALRRAAAVTLAVAACAAVALRSGFPPPAPERGETDRPLETGEVGATVDAGPEAAVRMVDRIQLFRTGNGGKRLELDGAELTALLRHAVPGMVPEGVHDPSVHIVGDEIRVRARVSPEKVAGREALADVVAALPEVVDVELRGRLVRSPDAVEFRIDRATVGAVPLPSAVVAALVRSWPGAGAADTPDAVLRAPWSLRDGLVDVVDGRVVIERPEPILVQSVDGSDGA